MTKFTDNLWRDLAREHGESLTQVGRIEPGPLRSRRPQVVAGGTLAVAAAAAAVTLGLTSTGSTTAGGTRISTDAYTITQSSSSVLVQINDKESINVADAKLNALIKEEVWLRMASGPAPVKGALTCTPGVKGMRGPQVKVLLGTDGTQVIAPGTTADNTGVGTWHMTACYVYPSADMGTGGTGVG